MSHKLVISCEHASNKIPAQYAQLYKNKSRLLASHSGWDIGANQLYRALIKHYQCDHIAGKYSRLLVELNRSEYHKDLFPDFLPSNLHNKLLENYYYPYHIALQNIIQQHLQNKHAVVHISVHSFTPQLNDNIRHNDIGLLYDPSRKLEKSFCLKWRRAIQHNAANIAVRFNYPYLGKTDGTCTTLRKLFSAQHYIGIELETNQRCYRTAESTQQLIAAIIKSLDEIL